MFVMTTKTSINYPSIVPPGVLTFSLQKPMDRANTQPDGPTSVSRAIEEVNNNQNSITETNNQLESIEHNSRSPPASPRSINNSAYEDNESHMDFNQRHDHTRIQLPSKVVALASAGKCAPCMSSTEKISRALEVSFDKRLLQKACRIIYDYHDKMEFFWDNHFIPSQRVVEEEIKGDSKKIDEYMKSQLAAQKIDKIPLIENKSAATTENKPVTETKQQGGATEQEVAQQKADEEKQKEAEKKKAEEQKKLDEAKQKKLEEAEKLKKAEADKKQKESNAEYYSEQVNEMVLQSAKRVSRKYVRLAKELYQYSFDLMIKELRSKIIYINFWKDHPQFEKLEDELEDSRANDMLEIEQRRKDAQKTSTGGHIGEYVEGVSWQGGDVTNTDKVNSQENVHEARCKDDEPEEPKPPKPRKSEVTLNEPEDVKAYAIAKTHTFKDFDTLLALQKEMAARRMSELIKAYNESINMIPTKDLLDENRQRLDDLKMKTNNTLAEFANKLSVIYNSEFSIMDIIFDTQFMTLYILKIINYGFFALSLYLAERLFSEMYMKKVYGNGSNPPDLLAYIGITLALNVAFILFLVVILLLIMYIFKSPSNTFVIDSRLIKKFLIDYMITTVIAGIIGVICGSIIQKKRYFRYKTEGLRGVRALNELMLSLVALITVVPFFYMVN